jgi:hypothetical protein
MDTAMLAASFAAAQAAQLQMAVAAKIMKMNADSAQAVVTLIDESQANIARLVGAAGPGLGGNLDISV